jgi:hypothetical protein
MEGLVFAVAEEEEAMITPKRSHEIVFSQIVLQNSVLDRRENEPDVLRVCKSTIVF